MRRLPAAIPMALLCAGLLSCAPLGERAGRDALHAYQAARAHHLARQPQAARAAYLQALQADPQHVNARNGLAALHAEHGALAQAIALWRDLVAPLGREPGPGAAYLFGNLGHALYLNGDFDDARIALEQACLLDPLQARCWQMLGQTLAALGHEARSQAMLKQAAALRGHDLRADFAAATGGASAVAAIGQALEAPAPRAEPGWDQAWVHTGADGMMELRRTSTSAPPSPLAAGRTSTLTARLEIRNGNGVTGMARALSRRIDEPGVQVMRLSNEPGFAVRQTRIDYTAPHLDVARRLAERLGNARLREVEGHAHADLRLVLGRDLARHGTALRLAPVQAPTQLLSHR